MNRRGKGCVCVCGGVPSRPSSPAACRLRCGSFHFLRLRQHHCRQSGAATDTHGNSGTLGARDSAHGKQAGCFKAAHSEPVVLWVSRTAALLRFGAGLIAFEPQRTHVMFNKNMSFTNLEPSCDANWIHWQVCCVWLMGERSLERADSAGHGS